jgi:hypothetical protein
MNYLEKLTQQISTWPGVSTRPHRFGGTEFSFGKAEIGHTHTGGIIDIPMPLPIHDALLEEGLAEQHRWVPNSGWITFHFRNEEGFQHALWLARLSYLRYALKTSNDPEAFLAQETVNLALTPRFAALIAKFLPIEKVQATAQTAGA